MDKGCLILNVFRAKNLNYLKGMLLLSHSTEVPPPGKGHPPWFGEGNGKEPDLDCYMLIRFRSNG